MKPALLIYDGECGLCRGTRDWVADRARPGSFEFITCQSGERAERAPQVAHEDCMEAVQLVLPDGSVYAGAAALPEILRRIPRWRWVAPVLGAPVVRNLTPPLYRCVAQHRSALGALLQGHRRDGPCDDDRCAR